MDQKKLFILLITASSILLLFVIIAVTFLLRNPDTKTDEPRSESVTPVPTITMVTSTTTNTKYPYDFQAGIGGLFSEVVDNSTSDGYNTYDITYTTGTDSFKMVVNTLETASNAVPKDRTKFNPTQYEYNPSDFNEIATINGQKLFVSKTGGTELVVNSEVGRLQSIPVMLPSSSNQEANKNEYYVYQLYSYGLSEYISAFNSTENTVPSYDNYFVIRYSIENEADANQWPSYQKYITDTIKMIQENHN